jgi:hypothetical protein
MLLAGGVVFSLMRSHGPASHDSKTSANAIVTPLPSPAPRLAPPGVFFATERLSVTTDSGVSGVDAGAKVLLLARLPAHRLKVTDGPNEFEVTLAQVTNDLDVAALSTRKDAASKAALAKWKQSQLAPSAAPERPSKAASKTHPAATVPKRP